MNLKRKGFTLIELLVVISIIGFLSTLAVVSLNNARIKSRDAKRRADIKQISTALDLHYDKRGAYTQPENMCSDTSYGAFGGCGAAGGSGDWDANSDLRDLITDGFLSSLPKDPINNGNYYYSYEPENAGQIYDLCARLESGGNFCLNKR